ncbi:MAG: carbon-nitrogen hydrolase family protein [Planctomycetota bacterium]|jgi:N-carbamoylputrescine amidase
MKHTFFTLALLTLPGCQSDPRNAQAPREPTTVRVAAISYVPVKFGLEQNAARLEQAFREAAANGAKIAVAPEGALDGYVVNEIIAGQAPALRMNDVALEIGDPMINRFQDLAADLRMCLVFGCAERIGDDVFNCVVYIDDTGAVRGKQHKMQFAEGYHPAWWFNRLGEKNRAFDTPYGRCGVLICNDRWNAQLAKIPVLDGAQYLVIPAYGVSSQRNDEAVLNRAIENNVPIIEANVGVTLVVDGGKIVAADRAKEGVTYGKITVRPSGRRDANARDAAERVFLAWRDQEMPTRFEAKMKKINDSR